MRWLLLLSSLLSVSAFAANPVVKIETSEGNIVIELNQDKAPNTVANFLGYVEDGFYDGTIFHRVISNFMVQGGGFDTHHKKKDTKAPIKNEADNGLSNVRGSIAMARTGDPHSATAQFFINVVDNRMLDHTSPTTQGWGYVVFGKVIEGMDVVDKIRGATTNTGSLMGYPARDVPVKDIVMTKVTVVKPAAKP